MPDENIKKLAQTLTQKQKDAIPKNTSWVTVEEVDWGKKTMTAKGVADGLEFFDVRLLYTSRCV